LDQLREVGIEQTRTLAVEVGREAATILMLAAVAFAVARNAGEWAAAFVITFGIWDITFYVFLKLLLDWPASLFTWDILFLVPVPWVGPVLAPVLVSVVMIAAAWHLRQANGDRQHQRGEWSGSGRGGDHHPLVCDNRSMMAGGMPGRFPWWLFFAGLATAVLSYVRAARRRCGGRIG
jgi:hypothetical protein